ncbi:hypothetical protein PP633_17680 [Mycobacteroides abscessus]|uniref:Uncharacterized protein n=1 Tax=Mycobacteroides abscessus subsp. bolletii 1513 TaxID=1299321 RepID=X8DMT5_9MYCO|nr:hypothetical protein [Mycobacteroides abscessus]EUA69346.1 hypothetical protein I540_2669 [Mycobacteroides abscessus subsp. bolletii 1513]AMU68169.1 hypothetical protein A3O04_04630 [Mycobacteroides abscessus]ARQ67041.1 hypothetical protein CAK77_04915 [Mycobacteroides abscessus subsp. massiliense]EIU12397.1 hypothetical protein MA5S0304_1545 [Mycobacteroides abscessus 5S-0304]EIU14178.1 hypothetical protein MA5S0421_1797 [Mycobacteroides abscessus 5S-0421]
MAEQTLLMEIAGRLVQDFPGLTRADVDAAVRQAYARFDSSPVRDFVPLFVEKRAHRDLGERYSVVPV